jgi:8-oxo-dGTP diphosphatase
MTYTYDYPRAMVTVDCAVFRKSGTRVEILLIRRGHEPFQDMWALPGGFIDMEETLVESASRELEEETGLTGIDLEQLHTFGNPGRDPRGRVVTIVFTGRVAYDKSDVKGGDDAAEARWFDVSDLPQLAFDHDRVIEMAVTKATSR